MGSLRTLFLGVHASTSIIRALFLPLCYLTLFSPFALAIVWYFGFGQTLHKYIPEDFSWFDLLPQLAISAVFVFLPTRLLSGTGNANKSKDGKRRVQSLPYYIPGFRHLGSIASGGEEWLKGVRESSTSSIVAYNAAGTKHNIVFSNALLDQVYGNGDNLEVPDSTRPGLFRNAFILPKAMYSRYSELQQEINKIEEMEVYADATKESLVKTSLKLLSESLPDFVTFNSSIVDQMQWERVANIELTDGTSEAECNLFDLINDFCCNAILPPLMGIQFTESYQLLASDLASFNSRFWALALGLPRLSPIQGLPAAALAQKRLLHNFTNLFHDLTNPPVRRVPDDDESVSGEEDTDADIVTPLNKLNQLFNKHDLPMGVRASIALHLVHGIYSEVVPLVFWTVVHIYSSTNLQANPRDDSSPLEKIKAETKTWAQAIQPPSIHPAFPAPPEIRFTSTNEAVKADSFPYLRSCINESRRLYNCSVDTHKVKQPFILKEADISRAGEEEQWELDTGSYIDVGLSRTLMNSSSATHPSPETFKPDRFINIPLPSSIISPLDKSEPYKTALLISLIAGITQLWEISPAPTKSFFEHMQEAGSEVSMGAEAPTAEQKAAKQEAQRGRENEKRKGAKWVMPKAIDGANVKVPRGDVRARIRRRENLPAGKVVGRIG